MPKFKWQARSRSGDIRSGIMDAASRSDIEDRIYGMGLTPTKVARHFGDIEIELGPVVSKKELLLFTKQFSTMIGAGLPLAKSLDILSAQIKRKSFKNVLLDVKNQIESGATFADALSRHPKCFDNLYVNTVSAGETGGILDTIMLKLSDYIQKADETRKKIVGAFIYPASVLAVAGVAIGVLLVYVVPSLQSLFASTGGDLPGITKMVVASSDWLQSNILMLFGSAFALFMTIFLVKRTEGGAFLIDSFLHKTPLVGGILLVSAVARMTRTLAIMLASGVPILEAIEIVTKTMQDKVIEKALVQVRKKISEGQNLAEPLQQAKIFPNIMVQMIIVGESTGELDGMLNKVADLYDEEVDEKIGLFTNILPTFLLVIVGGIIATILLAMYMPIFSLANNF